MTSNTLITREEATKLIDTLQGEALLVEIDKLIAKIEHQKTVIESSNEKYWRMSSEVSTIRNKVRNHFKSELDGDKDATVEMDLDDINGLLTDIGAEELKFTFKAEVTIKFTVTGIIADSEEDAENKVRDAIDFKINSDLDHDGTENEEYEVDDVEAE